MKTPMDRKEEDEALAAEYVVGVLSLEDRLQVERRMAQDANFAGRIAAWQMRLEGLNRDYGSLLPPDRVKRRIDSALFSDSGRPIAVWRWLTGAAIAGAIMFALFLGPLDLTPESDLRAELQGSDAAFAVTIESNRDTLAIEVTSATSLPGTVFELWYLADGANPVSLGAFSETSELPLLIDLMEGGTLAVSVEPTGGQCHYPSSR